MEKPKSLTFYHYSLLFEPELIGGAAKT